MFQIRTDIETCFAYRIPHENSAHYLKGNAVKITSFAEIKTPGIVIHSFSGDVVFFLPNTETISPENFEIHLRKSNPVVWTKPEYLHAFEKIQEALDSGQFKKLVLSRISEVSTHRKALEIFQSLNQVYTNTFNYLLSSPETGTWIGASPELLLQTIGNQIMTVSLAGTKPADGFSTWTPKEREEQEMVTGFILDAFRKNHIEATATAPYTTKAGPVEHLKTEISGTFHENQTFFSLLKDLHPTPATCGIPKETSRQKIIEIEAHRRELYTGFIGILGESEKSCFVNLRCMELQENRALLFTGGGITKASNGEREWIETERKSGTLKRVL